MPVPYSIESRRAIFLVSILLISSVVFAPVTSLASVSKSTTVWNGTINLVDGYTVESGEILIVEAGTEINLGDDKDILIAGRITIQGSSSSPVILNSIIGNHDGLIFNSSSNGLGSKIDNLTIRNSEYGITIYGSNPTINNLRVENRLAGSDTNPYLVFAANLASGFLGIKNKINPSPETKESLFNEETTTLPTNVNEALELIQKDNDLKEIFGEKFIKTLVAMRKVEYLAYMEVVSPWEREYLLLNV